MLETEVAVLGAGPHGLSAAAHLRRAGAEVRLIGEPMSFWRSMPRGMVLRSNWTATSIAEHNGPLSLDSYCSDARILLATPVPLDSFVAYGMWVQRRVASDVDRRTVLRVEQHGNASFVLTFDDGERLVARRLVVAAGIAPFPNRPALLAGLPADLVSHTADLRDPARFASMKVLVVGGGQSALESAALLRETGTEVQVAVRANHINWLHGGKYHRRLGRLAPLVYAPTDVGPMGISRIVAVPDLFRRLPRTVQDPMAARAIRPAGAAWLQPRLRSVPIRLGTSIARATPRGDRLLVRFDDGRQEVVDHLMFGTGYAVDVRRYPFLDRDLAARVDVAGGYPILRAGMESSVPGLHFLGAPAAWSFGPIMRFVAGGWYGAESLIRTTRRNAWRPPSALTRPRTLYPTGEQ